MHRRERFFTRADEWFAVRDSRGQWIVVDADGQQPLLSPDPSVRLFAVHLAAAAPALRAGAAEMVRRWPEVRGLYGYDRQISMFIEGSLSLSFPRIGDQRDAGALDAGRPRQLILLDEPEVVDVGVLPKRDRVLRLRDSRSR